jgi:hypothetical protein
VFVQVATPFPVLRFFLSDTQPDGLYLANDFVANRAKGYSHEAVGCVTIGRGAASPAGETFVVR